MQHVYDTISRSLNLPFARRNPRRLEDEVTAYHQTLNYDLWYRIASYLTIEDARSLAMVCKECHAATLPRLLSSVEPSDESGLQKMCTSLSSSVYYPASLLQGLRIGRKALGAPDLAAGWIRYRFQRKSPIPGALATLLSQAVNLRSLSLQCVEDLIEADARLGDALATLKCLDTLDLLDIGPKTFEVAMRIESRPTAFGLHYESRDSTSDDLLRLMEIPLLERVRKLVLYRFQFGNAPMNADLAGVKSLRAWPAVEELRLSFCSYLPFHQLFPNLRVLSLWRAWQMAGADMSLVAWPPAAPLRRATVDQHNIRCLLGTPVHFLDLKSYFVDREATLSAVRETSPVALSLWCPQGEGTSHEFWSGVISAANAPQARLRYLIITLPVDVHDGLRWLREIAPLLSRTRLLCIRVIVVEMYSFDPDQTRPHCGIANLPSDWQVFFRVAQGALARAVPSLRFVSMLYVPKLAHDVTAYLNRDFNEEDFAWWHVVAHEGSVESELFDTLPMDIGERIHRHLLSDDFGRTLDLNDQCFYPLLAADSA